MNYITLERGDMGTDEWRDHILKAIGKFGLDIYGLDAMNQYDRLMVGVTSLLRRKAIVTVRVVTARGHLLGAARAVIETPGEQSWAINTTLFTLGKQDPVEWWRLMERFMQEQPGPQPED